MKTFAAALALLWLVLAARLAWADGGFFPYPERVTNQQIRFDNLDDYPDWVFYVERWHHADEPVRVSSGEVIVLTSTGYRWVFAKLVAVPKRLAAAREEKMPPSEGTPGVLRVNLMLEGEVFLFDLNRAYRTTYQVAIENDKLKIIHSRREPIRPEINLGFVHIPIAHAALLLSFATTLAGLYYARKRSDRAGPNDTSPNTSAPSPSRASRVVLYLLFTFLVIVACGNFFHVTLLLSIVAVLVGLYTTRNGPASFSPAAAPNVPSPHRLRALRAGLYCLLAILVLIAFLEPVLTRSIDPDLAFSALALVFVFALAVGGAWYAYHRRKSRALTL